ncbi:MAG: NUDIX domain-containing protein, partial [Spirochaetia bacterium]|nr:NUDIX domain-containing protein [Spirochaetia bacterium]
VISGETSRDAALRELKEETGIEASEEEMRFLGTARKASSFVDIYLVKKNLESDAITLQEGETTAFRWVSLEQLEKMNQEGRLAFPVAFRFEQFRSVFKEFLD